MSEEQTNIESDLVVTPSPGDIEEKQTKARKKPGPKPKKSEESKDRSEQTAPQVKVGSFVSYVTKGGKVRPALVIGKTGDGLEVQVFTKNGLRYALTTVEDDDGSDPQPGTSYVS